MKPIVLTFSVILIAGSGAEPSQLTGQDLSALPLISAAQEMVCDSTRTDSTALRTVGLEGGGLEGQPGVWFGSIEEARLLPDGDVVVVDRVRARIHVLDSLGRARAQFGGSGEGPGEFASPRNAHVQGDSIVVFDPRLRRASIFSDEGELLGTVGLTRELTGLPSMAGIMPDGMFVLAIPRPLVNNGPSLVRDTVRLVRVNREGEVVADLGEFLGNERYVDLTSGFSMLLRPFGKRSSFAVSGPHVVVASGDGNGFEILDGDGESSRRVVLPDGGEVAVTNADIRAYVEERLRRSRRPEVTRRILADVPFPDEKPPYDRVIADRLGSLWLRLATGPHRGTYRYLVVDPSGNVVERVQLPSSMDVLDANENVVIVRVRGALEEQGIGFLTRACY